MITSEALRKLAALNLSSEQMAGVLEIIADLEEIEEARRKTDRERTRRHRNLLNITAREWSAIRQTVFERDGYRCVYCDSDVFHSPHCDHVIPLVQGGTSEIDNLATSCKSCNSSKAGRRPDEWRAN